MESVRRSMLVSVLCRGVNLGALMATPPVFLHFGSKELLGGWLVLIAIPATLNLFDLGVPHMAGSYMAISYAERDFARYGAIFWTSIVFSIVTLPAILLLAEILRSPIEAISVHDVDPVALALAVGGVVSQSQFNSTVQGGLRARGGVSGSQALDSSRTVADLIVVAWVLQSGGNLLSCIVWVLVSRSLLLVGAAVWLVRGDQTGRIRKLAPSVRELGRLFGPSTTYALSGAAQLGYIQVPLLLLGAVAGAGASAGFAALRTLSRMGPQLILPLLDPLRTQISAAYAIGDHATQRLILTRALQIVVWSGAASAAILILFGRPIFLHWTLGKISFDELLFSILLASSVLYGVSQVILLFLASIGRHKLLSIASFVLIAGALAISAAIGGAPRELAALLLSADAGICIIAGLAVTRVAPAAAEGLFAAAAAPPLWLVEEGFTLLKSAASRLAGGSVAKAG